MYDGFVSFLFPIFLTPLFYAILRPLSFFPHTSFTSSLVSASAFFVLFLTLNLFPPFDCRLFSFVSFFGTFQHLFLFLFHRLTFCDLYCNCGFAFRGRTQGKFDAVGFCHWGLQDVGVVVCALDHKIPFAGGKLSTVLQIYKSVCRWSPWRRFVRTLSVLIRASGIRFAARTVSRSPQTLLLEWCARERFSSGLNLYLDMLQNIPGEVLAFWNCNTLSVARSPLAFVRYGDRAL